MRCLLLQQWYRLSDPGLEEALVDELAPVGALQTVLARRVAVAAWRLARADRMEVEVLEFRSYEGASAGLALIRDGNATRSFETLMRYRSAAMAEFMRALRTLKALQAEPAATTEQAAGANLALELPATQLAASAADARAALPTRSATRKRQPSRTAQTRAPIAERIRHPRPARARPRPQRPRSVLDAERTRNRAVQESKAHGATANPRSSQACAPRSPRVAWTA
jgi:hypothetical protein